MKPIDDEITCRLPEIETARARLALAAAATLCRCYVKHHRHGHIDSRCTERPYNTTQMARPAPIPPLTSSLVDLRSAPQLASASTPARLAVSHNERDISMRKRQDADALLPLCGGSRSSFDVFTACGDGRESTSDDVIRGPCLSGLYWSVHPPEEHQKPRSR